MRGLRPGISALTRANVRRVRNATGVDLWLYDEIGPWGTSASDVASALSGVAPTDRVTLRINSPGGDVFDGIAIYSLLRAHPGGVDVIVDGLAASAASFIAMAGQSVTMLAHTRMMIHDAIGFAFGNAADMRELAGLLDDVSDNIAGIYADRSGRPAAEFRELMLAETWLSGPQALDLGLIDSAEDAAEGDPADPGEGEDDGEDGPDGPPVPPPAEGDDPAEDDPEDFVARWERSFAARASKLTRAETKTPPARPLRPAARTKTPPARPAPRSTAPAVDDIATILRGLAR